MFDFTSFLIYAAVVAMTPSPQNIMSMANATSGGFKRSLGFALGVWLGMSLVVLLCAVTMHAVFGLLPSIEFPMQVLGALYILYLAWKIFTASTDLRQKHVPCLFASGMLIQFFNVKLYVYSLFSIQVFVLPHYQGHMPMVVFWAMVLACMGFAGTMLWAWQGAVLKKVFTQYARFANTFLALCMVYCAVALFI